MLGVTAVLIVMLATNLFIFNSRVKKEAEAAFIDKLRKITSMATETRLWVASHQHLFQKQNAQGKRDINTVPVVVAWQIAKKSSESQGFEFRTPSLEPRNPDHMADAFEKRALAAFLANPALKEAFENETVNGREYVRFAVPVRLDRECLECHGSPAGEKDPFGFVKEGMKEGDLRAAFSVRAPRDELAAHLATNLSFGIFATLTILAVVCTAIFLMTRIMITRPLGELSEKMVAISQGDVNQTMATARNDEIGVLARSFNELTGYVQSMAKAAAAIASGDLRTQIKPRSEKDALGNSFAQMSANLRKMIRRLTDDSAKLASAATEIAASAEQMASGSKDQMSQAVQVSAAIEQMSANIQESAGNTKLATDVSKQSVDTAMAGSQVVSETIKGMQRIAGVVASSAQTIEQLAKSSESIGEITRVIDDIADQTNLLALNAAIEAARAGEQGRGFAVVADEVRKLAERTSKATGEITSMVKTIQSDTSNAVESMGHGLTEARTGQELVDRAGNSLNEIMSLSNRVMEMIYQVSKAAEQQSIAADEITKSVSHISEITRESSHGAEQSAQAATGLSEQAEGLRSLVTQFKLD